MKIKNNNLLAEFRTRGFCEWCNVPCQIREPAHISACGYSSAKRLDIRCNLVALGSTQNFCCQCHTRHHLGQRPTRADLRVIAAVREMVSTEDIQDVVHLFHALPKETVSLEPARQDGRWETLSDEAWKLAEKEFAEAKANGVFDDVIRSRS